MKEKKHKRNPKSFLIVGLVHRILAANAVHVITEGFPLTEFTSRVVFFF